MTELNYKLVVSGGGPAGLITALLLRQQGHDLLCLAPDGPPDPRTVALMQPAITLLERLGVWPGHLQEKSAALKQLHLLDDTGNLVQAPDLRFAAEQFSLEAFGWNIPLKDLTPTLRQACEIAGVTLVASRAKAAAVTARDVSITLDDGREVTAQAVVAADGAHSIFRDVAGIAVERWRYDQEALVTNFDHSGDHNGTSTEWHKLGGPFTTVPLPGRRSSLVWMDRPALTQSRLALSAAELARDIQLAGHGTLGLISGVMPPRAFVMTGARAVRFAARRIFVVGEAAHVLPPIGAQGLNLSIRDAGHLADVLSGADDPGTDQLLKSYDDLRQGDTWTRQTSVSLMNRSLLSDFLPFHLLRAGAMAAVAAFPALRDAVVREGLAPRANLPLAMR